jgi:predicted outer membrane repeat protein
MQSSRSMIRSYRSVGILFALVLALSVSGVWGADFYVDGDAALGGNGDNWGTAYKYLQDALHDPRLTSGDTILVAAGTYYPDEGGGVTAEDRAATFQLVSGVALYGGYVGQGAGNPLERNPVTNPTFLSGDLTGNDAPNFVNYTDNSYHVVTGSGANAAAILDGFTITAGSANGGGNNSWGGGLYIQTGNPTVHNCLLQSNYGIWGSGAYIHNLSSPSVSACVFVNNKATSGGTMYNENNTSLEITNCLFVLNIGGGIYNVNSTNVTIRDCTFNSNFGYTGGGMYNQGYDPVVEHCIFHNNTAVNGGGMYNNDSSPSVTNCTFYGNIASGTLPNGNGGGMYNYSNSDPVVRNCIFWGDTATTDAEIHNENGTSVPVVTFSDVQGGYEGTGNRDEDPLFADAAGGDFHLQSTQGRWNPSTQTWVTDAVMSPVINWGDPTSDFSAEPSPNGGRINMGAYGGTDEASKSDLSVSNNHPADYPDINMQMIITELTSYASSWKAGQDWPVEPNPIPITYVTRAGYLWKGGENYQYNSLEDPPFCWETTAPSPQFNFTSLESADSLSDPIDVESATVNRSFDPTQYTPEETVAVTIDIQPDAGSSYAVEDAPPAGWTVSNIRHEFFGTDIPDGVWDSINKKVKWGPYTDGLSRIFKYDATPPAGETGTKTFYGTFSPDGGSETINASIEPAVQVQYVISGHIQTSGGTAISGVVMNGLPGSPSTDGSGDYSASVDSGWSGTVTPTKDDYVFSPTSRPYSNVTSDQTNQDYTGTPTYTISGYVRTSGAVGISGVTMGGLPPGTTTNPSGYYSAIVNEGWSGTVTPSLAGYTFSPPSTTYPSVSSDQTNQDYTGTLNTYTISGNAGIAGAVMNGLPGNPIANGIGFYTATVDHGWSGTVTPTLTGYDFSPSSRPYSNVTSDQTDQNYTATLKTYTISGLVRTSGGTGIDGVSMGGLPGGVTTNGSGFYTATVDHGWSDTVTPSKAGYTFAPVSRTYPSVTGNQLNQDYTGTIDTFTISGTIQDSGGSPLNGVSMGGLPGSVTTNASGIYTATVDYDWSGTVTPSLGGYSFTPATRNYSNVTSDHTGENYTGTLATYTISGYVRTSGAVGISGVTMSGLPGNPSTDGSGFYTAMVDSGWSGTVTPSKADYIIDPTSKIYNNVTSDQTNQNYTGIPTSATFVISGYVRTAGSVGISGVTMGGLPGSPSTDGSGFYTATVSAGFSGTVTPSKSGYSFSPTSIPYSIVLSNQENQNYTGTPPAANPVISGFVRTAGGTPISGVSMGGLPGSPSTDGSGFYTATVTNGWTGTVTPSLGGYTFSPPSRAYSTGITTNQSNQDFTGTPTSPTTYTISGYVRTAGSVGISGVSMGVLGTTTDGSGFYTATVNSGFSDTVIPSKAGYTFSPTSIPYSNVTSNQTNQNYTGTLLAANPVISGFVRTAGGTGISGVTMSGLPGNPVTNASGFYTATVTNGWTGTVMPSLAGYTFSPTSIPYSNVTADQLNQNYTGTPPAGNPIISGYVRNTGGTGISGVTMGGLPGNPVTNASGFYTAAVTNGWSGNIAPTLAGYSFIPASRNYSGVTTNQSNQDYTGTLKTYTISGHVRTSGGTGIVGVTMGGLPVSVTTDATGFYTATVDHGYSGTVTPSKAGYGFTPPAQSYSGVSADQVNQNYEGELQGPRTLLVPSEYATIQAAIDDASNGDTVLVADDTYTGEGNRDLDLKGKAITVKSNGNGPDTCVIDCEGTAGEPHRGFIINSNEGADTIIEGFTIIKGYAGADGGGGIYCENSTPTIRDCTLKDNATDGSGGGIACVQAAPLLDDCEISSNTAANGGGVYVYAGDVSVIDCILQDNVASAGGASGNGGGIYIDQVSSLSVLSSKVTANQAALLGGGICSQDNSLFVLMNCLFTGNTSQSQGGAVYSDDSGGIFINCTLHGNMAKLYGGAIRADGTSGLDIANCISWGNSLENPLSVGGEIAIASGAWVTVNSCDIQDGPSDINNAGGILNWGSGNTDVKPQFVNPGYWDDNGTPNDDSDDVWIKGEYSLLPPSPCIDAGDDAAAASLETDLPGNVRIQGDAVDMGAYEYVGGLASSVINLKKMKVKASKTREAVDGMYKDVFSLQGSFDAQVSSFTNADTVSITIGPWSETLNRSDVVQKGKKSKYMYKGPPGGIKSLLLDFDKGTFTVTGKNCDLTGLTAPVPVILIFGDYYGYTAVYEDEINGKKPIPVLFLASYNDFLRVDKVACKAGDGNTVASLTVQGAITMIEEIDLRTAGLTITWGTAQYEIAPEAFTEKNGKFTAKTKASDTDPSSANVSIDFVKCRFKIVLKNTSMVYQASPVWFGLQCGSFDQGVEVGFE